MIWAFNARRASLSEALHIVARLPPAKAHNNISSSSNDDLHIHLEAADGCESLEGKKCTNGSWPS
jgi:hypothetical protein